MNRPFNVLDHLRSEKAIAGYLDEARQEGAEGFLDALNDVARARLVNQLAESTGIDRERLCGMFSCPPDEAMIEAIAKAMAAPLAVG
jgi:probable addiction module antidote protein